MYSRGVWNGSNADTRHQITNEDNKDAGSYTLSSASYALIGCKLTAGSPASVTVEQQSDPAAGLRPSAGCSSMMR